MNLHLWQRAATKEARRIVLSIIGSQQPPPTVQEIFKLAVQQESAAAPGSSQLSSTNSVAPTSEHSLEPRYPNHAIRSMRYLKSVVLPSLLRTKDIEKMHVLHELTPEELEHRLQTMTRSARKHADHMSTTMDVWRWQLRAHKPTPPKPKNTVVFGTDVGVGEDWSHLNRRRQRARVLKVTRDVHWLKELARARAEGRKAEATISS